jgi:hypothetical protein
MALNKYFAKLKYNDDFYTHTSFSLIPIYTITLITLRYYSNAFLYTTFMVCPPGSKIYVKTSWGSNSRIGNV